MEITFISDTHGMHEQLNLPKGDLLIHTGDISGRGKAYEVVRFLDWFSQQDYTHKVFIAGNHDFYFEKTAKETVAKLIPPTVTYLEDSGVTIEGIKIWGSPITPHFGRWAFIRKRGKIINKHWQLIPDDTDILLTHGPPHGILDRIYNYDQVGCEMLAKRIQEIQPKYAIFGHIHEAYGQIQQNNTHFINASVVNLQYQLVNPPVVIHHP